MKKNMKADLGIGRFVSRVQQNVRPAAVPEVRPEAQAEDEEAANVEDRPVGPATEEVVVTQAAGENTVAPVSAATAEAIPDKDAAGQQSVSGGVGDAPETPRGKGRPKKRRAIERRTQKLIRFDAKMCKELAMIKVLHDIDMQDFIYVAVERFRDEFFPGGKATGEGLDIIRRALSRINGEE